jgi:GNAT superfamily N-acetyltransferase
MSRFAIRAATLDDAAGVARAQSESWRSSYSAILPAVILDRLEQQSPETRKRIAGDRSILQLVAYDVTHGDIVGFCDAGPARRGSYVAGEIYALYLVQHAKRHGLGTEMFDHVAGWLRAQGKPSMIIWVLEDNHHARRFYEARGGKLGINVQSHVFAHPVLIRSYMWDPL